MILFAEVQPLAIAIFATFVVFVLVLSSYLGRRAKSASGYFAAGGQIHWSVNGIAFAGDYLSAASFLGICGMIATAGYDGFLYSIGYLAGWIVALFIVAEPMKRLGKYTFTDALDSTFDHRGIKLVAAISTLVVSIFYLIPQMVGAGVLVEPLLGLPHHVGVIMVGAIVIFIVATAGMASTTYVQFLKGGLLIVFSLVLTVCLLNRGLTTTPDQGGEVKFYEYRTLDARMVDNNLEVEALNGETLPYDSVEMRALPDQHVDLVKLTYPKRVKYYEGHWIIKIKRSIVQFDAIEEQLDKLAAESGTVQRDIEGIPFMVRDGTVYMELETWWKLEPAGDDPSHYKLKETQWHLERADGGRWVNGAPASEDNQLMGVGNLEKIDGSTEPTGPVSPFGFLGKLSSSETVFRLWKDAKLNDDGNKVVVHYPKLKTGDQVMRPGQKFELTSFTKKLNFASLMLALLCGTAALPHILIRYYTVPSPACARKSTIVAIASIGFFYILTMYMGLGALVNSVVNPVSNNMSAPLLARSFGVFLFAIISAIAFATVLGTVSGLIVAASGAVAHDLLDRFGKLNMNERQKVNVGKLAAFTVGLVAIILGIIFRGMNVSFLVGWAFAVAASANLPSILMLLFWKRTTARGITWSIVVGMVTSVGLILISPDMFERYGYQPADAWITISQPAIISMPLSFLTLVVVSLLTKKTAKKVEPSEVVTDET